MQAGPSSSSSIEQIPGALDRRQDQIEQQEDLPKCCARLLIVVITRTPVVPGLGPDKRRGLAQ
jgi:hypothetical protein